MNYRFGHCLLDISNEHLLVNGEQIAIERRNFLLLKILLEQSGVVVSREELINQLWPKQVVTDWSLSRLISDTRKLLGDNGKAQHIIKTCRGGGFMLVAEVITDDTIVLPKQMWMSKRLFQLILFLLVMSLVIVSTFYFVEKKQQTRQYKHVLAISQQLDITHTAFIAQLARRNELGVMLNILPTKERVYWEKAFRHAFDIGLSDEQQFVFAQIRAITTGALFTGNNKMYQLLQQYPELKQQLPTLSELERHLSFWLSKYNQVFLKRKDMCLLYVGVEDGVPFPSAIDKEVADWLLANKNHSS
jgi:DNA-binding winged helix-turn-helix (wHTH) protein